MEVVTNADGFTFILGAETAELMDFRFYYSLQIRGSGGDDTILASARAVHINGEGGDIDVTLSAQIATVTLTEGNDVVRVIGHYDLAEISTDAGNDLVDFQTPWNGEPLGALYTNAAIGRALIEVGRGFDTVLAGRGDDEIMALDGGDVLRGGGGDDEVRFIGADNLIYGDAGRDDLNGDEGGAGDIYGGAGADRLSIYTLKANIDPGDSRLYGGDGHDQIFVKSHGNDELYGGKGKDQIGTVFGDDLIFSGAGDDFIEARLGSHTIRAGSGNDEILLYRSVNKVDAGAGNDLISFAYGNNFLTGGVGNDTFELDMNPGRAVVRDFGIGNDVFRIYGMKGASFIGAEAFSGDGAEVRYMQAKGILSGDVDGDGVADWSIKLANKAALTADDFLFG